MHRKTEQDSPSRQAFTPASPPLPIPIASVLAELNHDIRTSMNGIVGMLELLRDTELSQAQRQHLHIARHSADGLLELIERAVDLALIETKQFRLQSTRFDPLHEVRTVCAGKKAQGLQCAVGIAPGLLVIGDPVRLRETVSSLVDVALRMAASGDIAVTMDAASTENTQCRLQIAVQTGALSAEGERQISLLSGDNDVAEVRGQGRLALDLAVCKALARMMDAHIGLDRVSAQGARLRLSLELPIASKPLPSIRGLLIGEHAGAWTARLANFCAQGTRIDAFDSAIAGLAAISKAAEAGVPYRVVMLEPSVQGMDASVLCAAVKGDPAGKDILLAMLGHAGEEQAQLEQAGFCALIRETADADDLIALLNRLWNAAAHGYAPPFLSTDTDKAPVFEGRRILVADDNSVNQQVAVRMLERLGCSAFVANNGHQAFDMHCADRFDLILMDCEMPEMDGYQATMQIRRSEQGHTPILALTACTGQGEWERSLAAGMDDFLSKPIRTKTLAQALERWLPPAVRSVPSAEAECEDELAAIEQMFGADFAELAALYRNDSPPRLDAMHRAHAAGDLALLAKVAHAVSGSSVSIGATGLSALCKSLELHAKTGTLNDFKVRMDAIEAEYRRVCGKLQSMLE